jgi:hypothetical protein
MGTNKVIFYDWAVNMNEKMNKLNYPIPLFSVTEANCLFNWVNYKFHEEERCVGLDCYFGTRFACVKDFGRKPHMLPYNMKVTNVKMDNKRKLSIWDVLSLSSSAWATTSISGLQPKTQELSVMFRRNGKIMSKNQAYIDSGYFCNSPVHIVKQTKSDIIISFDFSAEENLLIGMTKCMSFHRMRDRKLLCGIMRENSTAIYNCKNDYSNLLMGMSEYYGKTWLYIPMKSVSGFNIADSFPTLVDTIQLNYFKTFQVVDDMYTKVSGFHSSVINFIKNNRALLKDRVSFDSKKYKKYYGNS